MNNLQINESEIKALTVEATKEISESDLESEMQLWRERSSDPIGKTLNAIEHNFLQVNAATTDEFGVKETPITRYKMAYTMDGIPPKRWLKGLIQVLVNYDLVKYDERKGKCIAINGDMGMARLVNRLITADLITDTDGVMYTENKKCTNESFGQESTPEDVVNTINDLRSKGKMVGFDMSNYVDNDDNNAGYMPIVYDPENNVMYCGGATNSGVFREAEIDYDLSQSFDANLQALIEVLSQNLMDQGYYPRD